MSCCAGHGNFPRYLEWAERGITYALFVQMLLMVVEGTLSRIMHPKYLSILKLAVHALIYIGYMLVLFAALRMGSPSYGENVDIHDYGNETIAERLEKDMDPVRTLNPDLRRQRLAIFRVFRRRSSLK